MTESHLTSAEAAAALGVHQKTVVRWARRGRFPGAVLYLGSRRLGWRIPARSVRFVAHGGYIRPDGLAQPGLFEPADHDA